MKYFKRPLSILLAALMLISVFAIVPITASAEIIDTGSLYSGSTKELKQGDIIDGYFYDMGDSSIGDFITIKDADTDTVIASHVTSWTADKNYDIVSKAQDDISWQYGDMADVHVYTFSIREAAEPVKYLAADVDETTHKVTFTEKECSDYTVVTDSSEAVTWSAGWYVVNSTVEISKLITFTGDVNLILCDGAKLSASASITGDSDNIASFTVYAQSTGSDMGEMSVTGTSGVYSNQNITINGGKVAVTATGSYNTGIGADDNVIINGGDVNAAGVYSGLYTYDENVTINGGTVTTSGGYGIIAGYWDGDVIINDGTVTISGNNGSIAGNNVSIASGLSVKAGADESNAETVTDYETNFSDYKWAKIEASTEPTTAEATEAATAEPAAERNAEDWYHNYSEIKKGDVIKATLTRYEDAGEEWYSGSVFTIKDYDTEDDIVSRVTTSWTADKNYDILTESNEDISEEYAEGSEVREYIFYVRESVSVEPTTAEATEAATTAPATEPTTAEPAAEPATDTLDLTTHWTKIKTSMRATGFTTDHFSVQPASSNTVGDKHGWSLDGDSANEEYVTISALNGETITKIDVILESDGNTPILKANGNEIAYSRSNNTFTFENVNASDIAVYTHSDYSGSSYCTIKTIVVYYSGGAPATEATTAAEAEPKTVDISTLTGDYTANDGEVLTGEASDKIVTIPAGATVTLNGVNISNGNITCSGDANIILTGDNSVAAPDEKAAIQAGPSGTTLTITGTGSLTAKGGAQSAGIGSGGSTKCGNITIDGGTVTATGGGYGAGIGSACAYSDVSSCGNITISGGTVTATGGQYAAGIGSGPQWNYYSICGKINIQNTVTSVTAIKGASAPNSIGKGYIGSCGTVTIGGVEGVISKSPYTYPVPTYTVTWKNADGTELEKDTDVAEGEIPSYDGDTPTKAEDDDNTYTFSGWTDGTNTYGEDDTLPAVTGDITYTATYTENPKPKSYTITWADDAFNVIDTTVVDKGTIPTHADPVKSDPKNIYTFTGWTPELKPATEDTVYSAQFDETPIFYSVGDTIDFGNAAFVQGMNWTDPTTEVKGKYTITSATYDGDNSCYNIVLTSGENTINLTAYAMEEYEKFAIRIDPYSYGGVSWPYSFYIIPLGTVIWKDENGNVLEVDEDVPQGSVPSFSGDYTKESDAPEDYYYETRWLQEYNGTINKTPCTIEGIGSVNLDDNGQAIYHAKLIKVKAVKQDAVFFPNDGLDVSGSYVEFAWFDSSRTFKASETLVVKSIDLYNSSNNSYMVMILTRGGTGTSAYYYNLDKSIGDKAALKYVSGDGTQDNPYTFDLVPYSNVTWKNGDDILKTDTIVDEGTTPSYDGDTPTKAEDDTYTYTFSGWTDGTNTYGEDDTLPAVTGDITYTATFTAAEKRTPADDVKDLINALPDVDKVTTDAKEAIEAARKAYDALDDAEKEKIDADTLKKLTDAETALAAAEKDAADTAAANTVSETINALPDADKVTTADKDAIEAARKAYDDLTDDQKAKVDAETLKKLTDAETALAAAEKKAAEEKAAKELAAAKKNAQKAMNAQVVVTQKGKKITVKWNKSTAADGYMVYVQYCGKKIKKAVKTIKNNKTTKLTLKKLNGKKLNLKKQFRVYVKPYKIVNGKKKTLAKSIVGHIVGVKNKKFTNVKSIKVNKKAVAIQAGKAFKIKAKVKLVDKTKKHISKSHAAKFRYRTSDKNIATVTKSGKIKGINKGTCTVYVYAINGKMKKVKVTVK